MECNISEYTEQEIIIRPVAEIRKGKEDDYGFAKLEDKDIKGEESTDWMPIAADYASTESGFWGLPEIGTMAVAVYSPEYKQGIIIGFLYDEKHKPPVEEGKNAANRTILQTKKHRFEITDEDGTEEISLTTAKGKMKVVLDGEGGIKIINVMKEGKINLNAEDSIEIESEEKGVQLKDKTKGELKIESEKSLKITPDKDIMIKASGELKVKCSKIKLSGSKGITAKGKQVAKQDDKVVGLDTHIIMIPSINGEVPTPIPHPFTGQLKEKLEDCVKIGYKKVAVKGSVAKHGTGHIPQGPRFQNQPNNKGEITGGTEPSVKVKGKEIAVLGSSVSTCSDVGERENSKVIAAGTSTAATEKMLKKLEEEANAATAATAAQAEQKPEEKKAEEKQLDDTFTENPRGQTVEKNLSKVKNKAPNVNIGSGVGKGGIKSDIGNCKQYSVMYEASPGKGTTRGAHRNAANREFYNQMAQDSQFKKAMDGYFGYDVMEHMKSGKSGLKNPSSNWVWHHPANNPNAIQLIPKNQHQAPILQPILHPGENKKGGFGLYFNN